MDSPKNVEEIISRYGRMTKVELTSAAKKLGVKISTGANYAEIMKLIAEKFNINCNIENFPKRKLSGKKETQKIFSGWNINSLHFKNIYAFGDRPSSVHFENGVTAIVGENGVGKTCLVNIIKFALFNQTPVLRSGIKHKNSINPLYVCANLICDGKNLTITVDGKNKSCKSTGDKLEITRNIVSDTPNTPTKKFESEILGDSDFFEDVNYFTLESFILRRRHSDILKLIKHSLELDISEKKLETIRSEQRSLSTSIKNCPETFSSEKFRQLEKSISDYKTKIFSGNPKILDDLIQFVREHTILSAEKNEFERRQTVLEKIAELEKSASQIKTKIPESVLADILLHINQFVADLIPVTLKLTDSQTFEVEIEKTTIELNALSNYQRLLIELALRSALIKFSWRTCCRTLIIDEGFNYINTTIIHSHIPKIFARLKTVFDKIIFITHNPKLSELADHIIQITPERKISKIK